MARKNPKRKACAKNVKDTLRKMNYELVGETAAVQVCRWTRNSLNKKGGCWKEKFYGIKSHRCCQMSPAVMWCENKCLHCWRPIEMSLGDKLSEDEADDPKELLDGIVEARKKLLMGFKGNKNVSEKRFNEACEPTLFTLSLSGEPTIYPKLSGLIKEIRARKAVSFLVTNGLNPDAIRKLASEKNLPTQLTVSMNAPNEKLFTIWHRSTKKNAWKVFNETLGVIKNLKGKTRRALRLTLVKGEGVQNMSEENISEFAKLILKAEPDFVHVKGFMSVGYARDRMGYEKMPWHYEIKRFGEKLLEELNKGVKGCSINPSSKEKCWKVLGEEKRSCVLLLGKSDRGVKIKGV
jgi:tRNA wybutosine-synthesizing protein 1